MARLVRNNLTATLRQPNLVALLVSPCRVGTSCTRHDHHRNRQLMSSAPDLCGTLPNMDDFVRGRLVSGGAEGRRAGETLQRRRQGLSGPAERHTEESKYSGRREKWYERSDPWNAHLLVLMRRIDENETHHALTVFGREDAHE